MKPYKEILNIFSAKDTILKEIIKSVNNEIKPTPSIDVYLYLLRSIASQQLSIKVVRVIWRRFSELFVDGYPDVEHLLMLENSELRTVGLSNSKVQYIQNVAQFSVENDISFEYLNEMKDEEIISYLTQIKGVGRWTVQMILMFPMDRPNVFPVDDLGIQTRMKHWYNINLEKKALKSKLLDIAESWSPYKTLACKYIWESNK